MNFGEERHRNYRARVILIGGNGIWERYKDSGNSVFRRVALRENARALVEHDRMLTGIDPVALRRKR